MTSAIAALREEWRARVEAELAGTPFASLIGRTLDGIDVEPLYDAAPHRPSGLGPGSSVWTGVVYSATDPALTAHLHDDARGGATCAWIDAHEGHLAPNESGLALIVCAPSDGAASLAAVALGGVNGALRRQGASASIDTVGWHDAGANAVLELALACAAALDARRAGSLDELWIGAAIDTDFFNEICKLRALRVLLRRALGSFGPAPNLRIAARTSRRFTTPLDDATTLVRSTIAASAALVAGADAVCVEPHDSLGARSESARRIARNIPLVLMLESRLGEVRDAARGSYFVETRTDQLARAAWERVRLIEGAGGLAHAGDLVAEWIDAAAAARASAVATRRAPRVGVSRYAAPGQQDAPQSIVETNAGARDAAAFESLRRRSAGVRADVVWLGQRRPLEARASFVRDVLEVGGVAVAGREPAESVEDALAQYAGEPWVVTVCADAAFGDALPDLVRGLRGRGARWVSVAGKPGAHEAALRAAGVDDFIFVGADVIAFVDRALHGVSSR